MKKIFLFSFVLLMFQWGFSQISTYQKNYDFHKKENIQNKFYYTHKQDSIMINGNLYFFKTSPITFVDGYRDFICNSPMVLPRLVSGYTSKWQIENGNLYISDIIPYEAVCEDSKSGIPEAFIENKSVAREKLAKLTESKYNSKGLLPAEWVDGEFLLYKYPVGVLEGEKLKKGENYLEKSRENNKRFASIQEVYIAVFKNGKLKSFERNTELEKKYHDFAQN
ncbi:hypothetical protein ACQ1Q5_05865 [Ornithobacterium rhinotracheale]